MTGGVARFLGLAAVASCGLLLLPATASAQRTGAARVFVFVDFGIQQPDPKSFAQTIDFPTLEEIQTETNTYTPQRGQTLNVGGGVFFTPLLGVGVAVNTFSRDQAIDVFLNRPHPQFFESHVAHEIRPDGSAQRRDQAFHLSVLLAPLQTNRMSIILFGGPSRFTVKQDLVADYLIEETIQLDSEGNVTLFDWAFLEPFAFDQQTSSGWGFHVGADVAAYFARNLGAGLNLRFDRGTVPVRDMLEQFYNEQEVFRDVKVGGFTISGGLRLRF